MEITSSLPGTRSTRARTRRGTCSPRLESERRIRSRVVCVRASCVERSAFLCFWWLCDWTDGNRYDAARFGIKIHWGPYAVPAYGALGQYAEQYARWYRVGTEGCGTDANPISSGCDTALFHRSTFGSMPYEEFYNRFNPILFDAAQWADIFRRGGAWHLSDLCGQLVHGCTNN